MKAAKKRPAFLQQSPSRQDIVLRNSSPSLGHLAIVARSRFPTQKEPNSGADTSSSAHEGRSHRSPLTSSVEASPSNAASLPIAQILAGTNESDTREREAIKYIQIKDIDKTPWQEYEIPSELEIVQPSMPEEIRNIVQESLDEQRAMRLSALQSPAIVVGMPNTADQVQGAEEEPVVAESSATASNRHPRSSLSSLRTDSVDLSLDSTTSLGSSNVGKDSMRFTTFEERITSRSSGESQHSDLKLASRRLQKGREKLSKAHGLFKMLRRPKDAIPIDVSEQEPEMYECTSCFDDIPNKEAIRVPCRHTYCAPCFSQLISTALQNESQFPPKCCLQEIPRGILRNHLDAKELASFDDQSVPSGLTQRKQGHRMAPWNVVTADCPQDFGLDATLQQAERAGWQRCYNCRAMVELNTGCRHITCKCKAEFCYTCGARWRTCVCTEDDQARRAQQIRENLERLEAEARAEEEEIRAAIAAVEEAERQAAEERREEERRQEEARAEEARQMAMRESERMEKITQHFNRLRDILDDVRTQQNRALSRRHESQMQEIDTKETALEAPTAEPEDANIERARIASSTDSKIQELRKKHATELVQTRSRHRKDEDECLLRCTEQDTNIYEDGEEQQKQQAADPATVLETLLSAQELERSTLRAMQAREIEKCKRRGALHLRLFDESIACRAEEREREYQRRREELVEECRGLKRRQWAEWKWVEVVAGERERMLGEDERRMVLNGGEVVEEGEVGSRMPGAFIDGESGGTEMLVEEYIP
ncbi:MAG: hypothetical protein Q9225_000063 [Loekoesia sp. 1 TL-2023]